MEFELFLKPERDRSVRQRHPWIFTGAVGRITGEPESGETLLVRSAAGEALGFAAYSPTSKIVARMWNWNPEENIDETFFRRVIRNSIDRRKAFIASFEGRGTRLIHAESDGLAGVVADRYNDWLSVQFLTAGAERWKEGLVEWLCQESGLNQVFERSDVEVRKLEGLPERNGVLRGLPTGLVEIEESGLRYFVDLEKGQKTGFYLDQRLNRMRTRELTSGRRVLNCFCYTGGFSAAALAGGAVEVLSIDSSAEALSMAVKNVEHNGFGGDHIRWQEADVFMALRKLRDQNQKFDAIILDPPKFAPTAAQAVRAARGYKDINLLAFKLLNPGGLLFTFSCSGGISAELFQKIIAGAALDAGVEAGIIENLSQSPDHPVALNFPEGAYLKGLVCQVR